MSEENDAESLNGVEVNFEEEKEIINDDNYHDNYSSDSDFTRKTIDIDAKISEEIRKEFLNLENEYEFNEHLQGKLDKLNIRLKKLQQKYYSWRKYKLW